MKLALTIVDAILLVPMLLLSAYLAFLPLLAAYARRHRRPAPAVRMRNFAMLIPAHDEELVIQHTIESIKAMNYPRPFVSVYVIADNCTDDTEEIAARSGAVVFVREDHRNIGKGHAIRWCLEALNRPKNNASFDAFVIIDADTIVSPNLLSVINDYLEDGAQCIQCSDMIAPQPGSWSSEITRVAFFLHNYVRPMSKMAFGGSAGLNGNGMCLSRELLQAHPWDSYSRVEDLEYAIRLTLNGINVRFAPEASVHATMPSEARTARSQRRRWELGRIPVVRQYLPVLAKAILKKPSLPIVDTFVELLMPAFTTFFVSTVVLFLTHLAAAAIGIRLGSEFTALWGIAVLLCLIHVFAGLKVARADRGAYVALANSPRYIVWKLLLYATTWLRGDDRAWIRTARDAKQSTTAGRVL